MTHPLTRVVQAIDNAMRAGRSVEDVARAAVEALRESDDLQRRALAWIVSCDTGASSKTIWAKMQGVPSPDRYGYDHPSDPADLGRCLRLFKIVPEWKYRLNEMVDCGPAWKRLVDRWDELHACMEREVGIDWSKGREAPETYGLMQSIIRPATMGKGAP